MSANKWIKESYIINDGYLYYLPSVNRQRVIFERIQEDTWGGDVYNFLDFLECRRGICSRKGDLENFKYWTAAHNFHHNGKLRNIFTKCCPLCRKDDEQYDGNTIVSSDDLKSEIRESYIYTVNKLNKYYRFDLHTLGYSLQTVLNNAL